MSEAEIKKNPCGENKEIDEYLNGTVCEIIPADEDLNDIKAPAGEEYEVHEKQEPEKLEDEYLNKK